MSARHEMFSALLSSGSGVPSPSERFRYSKNGARGSA